MLVYNLHVILIYYLKMYFNVFYKYRYVVYPIKCKNLLKKTRSIIPYFTMCPVSMSYRGEGLEVHPLPPPKKCIVGKSF